MAEMFCPLRVGDVFDASDMETIDEALKKMGTLRASIARSKVKCCLGYERAEERLKEISVKKPVVRELETEGCFRDTEQ